MYESLYWTTLYIQGSTTKNIIVLQYYIVVPMSFLSVILYIQ